MVDDNNAWRELYCFAVTWESKLHFLLCNSVCEDSVQEFWLALEMAVEKHELNSNNMPSKTKKHANSLDIQNKQTAEAVRAQSMEDAETVK